MELVGHSIVIIGIYKPAVFVGPDDPQNPAVEIPKGGGPLQEMAALDCLQPRSKPTNGYEA